MTHQTPCSRPENDPNDWFIGKDGRQYSDVPILSEAEVLEIAAQASSQEEAVDLVLEATDKAERDALRRRRHAKDACHVQCYFRVECLRRALDEGHESGTWGGYFEEELREVRKEKARREREERRARLGR